MENIADGNPYLDRDLLHIFEQIDDENPHRAISAAVLYRDIVRVATELGHLPSIDDYAKHGNHAVQTITSYFSDSNSWPESLRELGYDYTPVSGQPEHAIDDLIADLQRVVDELGRPPKRFEYDKHGQYSSETLRIRCSPDNTWPGLLATMGLEIR
jgi:hypothetical protein